MFCDTHCHIDFEDYDADRSAVLERAKQADLCFLINPGIDLASSKAALSLSQEYLGFIFAAVGIHPNYVNSMAEGDLERLSDLAHTQALVAIGEIGLDYYREYSEPAQQREAFLAQLDLAARCELPVIIHNREASRDLVPILNDWQRGLPAGSRLKRFPGVLHAYSGSLDEALELAELNFAFGLGGPVTYHNGAERRAVAAGLPLQKILLETDAPFLTPHPHRGKRNEPAYIPLIAAEIARLHKRTPEEVGEITTQNAIRLFNLDSDILLKT
jgi:TatD DNase family protein